MSMNKFKVLYILILCFLVSFTINVNADTCPEGEIETNQGCVKNGCYAYEGATLAGGFGYIAKENFTLSISNFGDKIPAHKDYCETKSISYGYRCKYDDYNIGDSMSPPCCFTDEKTCATQYGYYMKNGVCTFNDCQGHNVDNNGNCTDECLPNYVKQNDKCQEKCDDGYVANDDSECVEEKKEYVADNPCEDSSIKKVLKIVGFILLLLRLFVPFIIIGFGIFDVYKSIVDQDEKSLSKQLKILGLRIVGGVFLFFIPPIVNSFLNITNLDSKMDSNGYTACYNCLTDPNGSSCVDTKCSAGEILANNGKCYEIGTCGSYITEETCPKDKCQWFSEEKLCKEIKCKRDEVLGSDGNCHKKGSCILYNDESSCSVKSCYWTGTRCRATGGSAFCTSDEVRAADFKCYAKGSCGSILSDSECNQSGKCWWNSNNNMCISESFCSSFTSLSDCNKSNNCEWNLITGACVRSIDRYNLSP